MPPSFISRQHKERRKSPLPGSARSAQFSELTHHKCPTSTYQMQHLQPQSKLKRKRRKKCACLQIACFTEHGCPRIIQTSLWELPIHFSCYSSVKCRLQGIRLDQSKDMCSLPRHRHLSLAVQQSWPFRNPGLLPSYLRSHAVSNYALSVTTMLSWTRCHDRSMIALKSLLFGVLFKNLVWDWFCVSAITYRLRYGDLAVTT